MSTHTSLTIFVKTLEGKIITLDVEKPLLRAESVCVQLDWARLCQLTH